MKEGDSINRTFIRCGKILAWIIIIWLGILIVAQAILSSGKAEKIIARYASEYIDGNISSGKIEVSMFRHFPNIGISISDFSITYPSEMFEPHGKDGPESHFTSRGRGIQTDTLAAFDRFSISINLLSAVSGKIHIPYAELSRPRIFAHRYHDGQANWNIIKVPTIYDEPAGNEDDNAELPEIRLGRIGMKSHPHIVYTDRKDTLFAVADMKQARLFKDGFRLDSMFIAGRTSKDTVAFGMERLAVDKERRSMLIHAKGDAMLATRYTGRLRIPVEISSRMNIRNDEHIKLGIREFNADIASIPVEAQGIIGFKKDRMEIHGDMAINECRLEDVAEDFLKKILKPDIRPKTDATLSMQVNCNGDYIYSTGALPEITASAQIEESVLKFKGAENDIRFKLDALASTSEKGGLKVSLNEIGIGSDGIDISAKAACDNILENDPDIYLNADMTADLFRLESFMPDTSTIEAGGLIKANINGNIRPSYIDIYKFSHAGIKGSIVADSIMLRSASDSLNVDIDSLHISLQPEKKTSKLDSSKSLQLIGMKVQAENLDVSYKAMNFSGEDLVVSAMNSVMKRDTSDIGVLGGRINASRLILNDASGTEIMLKGTANGFQMIPQKERPEVPLLTFNSINDQIIMKDAANRAILTDAEIRASAAMNTVERKQKMKNFMDSLARKYPDIPKDSLMSHLHRKSMDMQIPEWLKEEDFRKQDINIKLDETLAGYFRNWDMQGDINIRTGILMTPYFPIRNILKGCQVQFDNDKIQIDSLKVISGSSEIGAEGSLTGLKRTLLGRGGLKLDLDIYSGKVNANELLSAYSAGSRYVPPTGNEDIYEVSNAEFYKMVTTDTLATKDTLLPLIVVPANLNADIRLNASDISYSDLLISKLKSRLIMKERCIQITGTEANSNAGGIDFEGFYSTRTKKDIKAGFSFNFKDITAEKVIGLVPAVDSLMPILKSFNGQLDCELAATAGIDTCMNIIPSSINGIIRIEGKDLRIKDSEMFRDLAKKLMFKNKKEGYIDEMSVEGIISDSMLEIFPFILKMDRYTLAMSGIQRMDESFKYHASLIKSPFVIRLGVDLYGDNFDDIRYKIGKAKYKSTKVPAFSAVIDTTKVNLLNSIRGIFEKGVDAAVAENERQDAIQKHKKKISYTRAVDQELEDLSENEKKQMESQEAAMKETEKLETKLSETVKNLSGKTENK